MAAAAGLSNLDIIESEQLIARGVELEHRLFAALASLEHHDAVQHDRGGLGLMVGVQMVDPGVAQRVSDACLAEGFIVRVITNGTLQISPPFTMSIDEIGDLADALARAIDDVSRDG